MKQLNMLPVENAPQAVNVHAVFQKGYHVKLGLVYRKCLDRTKIGGPLKSMVTVERANKSLVLNFKIVGQGGEAYRSSGGRDTAPRFTVFKGVKQIHSGQFEYG